jgi:type IV fimbrial biogenesis protein FimT
MNLRRSAGFTLIELMVTLTVIGISLVFAAPNLVAFIQNYRITTQTNNLLADLQLARNNSVAQGVPVSVCASTDGATCVGTDWSVGRIVFTDANGNGAVDVTTDAILRVTEAVATGSTIIATNLTTAGRIQFRPSGLASGVIGGGASFKLCDSRTGAFGRTISIAPTGRAAAAVATC